MCDYAYLPHFTGTLKDNINAIEPEINQKSIMKL